MTTIALEFMLDDCDTNIQYAKNTISSVKTEINNTDDVDLRVKMSAGTMAAQQQVTNSMVQLCAYRAEAEKYLAEGGCTADQLKQLSGGISSYTASLSRNLIHLLQTKDRLKRGQPLPADRPIEYDDDPR